MDYETIKNWPIPDVVHEYTERDTQLYALGVGYGGDPLDERQLRYVSSDHPAVAPTMAAVLGSPGPWMLDSATGVDAVRMVHAEHAIALHQPLSPAGAVVGRTRVSAIVDKGADKGALVYQERSVNDRDSGALLATIEHVTFCRGDGGLERSDTARPTMSLAASGEPDAYCDLPTVPQAALIYRLSGDRNPLHSDPTVAAAAGFDRPILHGLCTLGVAVHALLRTVADYEPNALRRVAVRFSAPVFPGETVRTELWRDGATISFRARVLERDVVVLTHGRAELAP